MQRIVTIAWALGPAAVLLAQASFLSSCMSLRHKVDPVSITLNVKLENVDPAKPATASADTAPSKTTSEPKRNQAPP